MRTHKRIDTVKVFQEDDERIERIKSRTKLKNKTDVYREGLRFLDENYAMHEAVIALTNKLADMTEKMDDLYFKIDTLTAKK